MNDRLLDDTGWKILDALQENARIPFSELGRRVSLSAAVALSTRFALESERVTTDVIMVPLFPYLAVRYGVSDVPTTVVNGKPRVGGPLDEAAYLAAVLASTMVL